MKIIGLMSGTSLDGLDVAYCEIVSAPFDGHPEAVSCKVLAAETYPYPEDWVRRLSSLENASAFEYALAHVELGHYMGKRVAQFRQAHPGSVDYVASHGHTIFHQPQLGLTTQIGDADAIAAEAALPVVSNFRTFDVALGGQGAPLVPIGDRLLFGHYDACLNLGGIANISYEDEDGNCAHPDACRRIAFDISPCNMALNLLARRNGASFDRDGAWAKRGSLLPEVLAQMDRLEYYRQPAPKSLGKEWFVAQFAPLIDSPVGSTDNLLRTSVEHIARQVAAVVNGRQCKSLLVTGGGARNCFLIERFRALMPHCEVVLPDPLVIDYKEAMIFALLGFLRVEGRNNCLASVTGARRDNCGGTLSGL